MWRKIEIARKNEWENKRERDKTSDREREKEMKRVKNNQFNWDREKERERERERENAELTGAKIIEIADASFNCNLKLLQTLHFILHSIKVAATLG